MRTTSSFRFVGVLTLPKNLFPIVGAGKMPAVTNAVAFGSIMHAGMVLFGKACPCTMPAGRAPGPGPLPFLAKTEAFTFLSHGTVMVVTPKLPPEGAGLG